MRSIVAGAVLALAASASSADERCDCQPRLRRDVVDLARRPSKVESQNKIRIAVERRRDPKKGALTIDVSGKAYFPDGTVILVAVRHWKCREPFRTTRATVKDRVFETTFGPFAKAIPQGGVAVGAFFVAERQTDALKAQLVRERYYHSSPPCEHDLVSSDEVAFTLGGAEAEALDEADEKAQIAAARRRVLDARAACDRVLASVEKKAAANDAAVRAIKTLKEDLEAAAKVATRWAEGRETVLFRDRFRQVATLRARVLEDAELRAALAGVPGFEKPKGAAQRREEVLAELTRASDDLRGFLDDPRALDSAWDKASRR